MRVICKDAIVQYLRIIFVICKDNVCNLQGCNCAISKDNNVEWNFMKRMVAEAKTPISEFCLKKHLIYKEVKVLFFVLNLLTGLLYVVYISGSVKR